MSSSKPSFVRRLGERKLLSSALVAATLALGIFIGTVIPSDVGAADEGQPVARDATPLVIPDPEPVDSRFTDIARKVRASVVNISVDTYRRRVSGDGDRNRMEEFFRRFFDMPEDSEDFEMPRPRFGEGSGVIVDPKGYIITNRHVVDDADRIRVRFDADDDFYDADLIGADDETDLAVIKVSTKGKKLQAAVIGNSDAVSVGDWALAIGSPFGFRESVTAGIISAKSREVQSAAQRFSRPFQKFFQTDAAINPGNSGGPLVNIRGELIGINTAIVSSSGSYQGLGFALPSNIAVAVYNQIIQHGRVARGSIGIRFAGDQDAALLRTYGAENGGVFVMEVTEGWPAEKAGMQAEDIIVSVDGKPISDGDQLIAVVASKPVGSTVAIEVIRNKQPKTLDVEIADREELLNSQSDARGDAESSEEEPANEEVGLGVTLRNLTSGMREELQYEDDDGVLITEVEPGSFADDVGLFTDDIIVAINRRPTRTIEDVREIREELKPGDDIAFKVMRRDPGGTWIPVYPAGILPGGGARF